MRRGWHATYRRSASAPGRSAGAGARSRRRTRSRRFLRRVSVEKVEEGLKAIEYPGVASVQIIYNIYRQRPARLFLREARRKGVAVIVRVRNLQAEALDLLQLRCPPTSP